jgi:hypothetical protein
MKGFFNSIKVLSKISIRAKQIICFICILKIIKVKLITACFLLLSISLFAQPGKLHKRELFTIPAAKFPHSSGFSFKIAVDSRENIAFNACSNPLVYIYDSTGVQVDSFKLAFSSCVRSMEFDEDDNLLVMDNDELNIYRYNLRYRKLETFPYQKPEDWFRLINHYYREFDISTIPTYYSNNDYLQDFYNTRFNYSYNLYFDYKNSRIYQCHFNFLKKIGNQKMYTTLKKENYWLSDNISIRTKVLLVDDSLQSAVYFDRFYNLIYENFKTNEVYVNAALTPNSEAARFDYATNIKEEKIWGISSFNRKEIVIAAWSY